MEKNISSEFMAGGNSDLGDGAGGNSDLETQAGVNSLISGLGGWRKFRFSDRAGGKSKFRFSGPHSGETN